jgi:hypothetical protein
MNITSLVPSDVTHGALLRDAMHRCMAALWDPFAVPKIREK